MTAIDQSPPAPTVSAEDPRSRVAALLARDRWPREALLEHQRAGLRALLRDAAAQSPYYRELLGPPRQAETLPLEALPTLSKATLMEQWDRVVTDPRLRLAGAERHLLGPEAGERYLGKYRLFTTSGSTGLRGVFAYTGEEFATWVAVCLRGLARGGVTPESRLVGIGAPSPLHVSKQLVASFQSGRDGVPQLSVVTPLAELVSALNADRPDTVVTYPSIAGQLADEQLEGSLRIAPERVVVVGEVVTDEVQARIAEAWGAPPFEVYAATEAPLIASASPERVGMHIVEDVLMVEVVDEQNRQVRPGEAGAKLLVTNLVNRIQPLIRYELSDEVTMAPGPDPSGRPYGRIARVDGRSDDVLRFPALAAGEVAVHPYRLRAPFASLPEVRQYQIVHRRPDLDVHVVLRAGAGADAMDRVRRALLGTLEAAGAVPPRIDVTAVPTIPREGGDAAKFKLIKAA